MGNKKREIQTRNKKIQNKELEYLDLALLILLKLDEADDYLKYNDLVNIKNASKSKTDVKFVLNILMKNNIINSARGNKGGYFLTETIRRFTVKEIYTLIKKEYIYVKSDISFKEIKAIFDEEYIKYQKEIEEKLDSISLKDLKK